MTIALRRKCHAPAPWDGPVSFHAAVATGVMAAMRRTSRSSLKRVEVPSAVPRLAMVTNGRALLAPAVW